jgi:Recombination endonuclease VII
MTKTCPKCKVEKDEREFPKCKTAKDGLHHWCKACNRVSCAALRLIISERPKIIPKTRMCTKCKAEKDARKFYKNKYDREGLTNWCKDCIKEHQLEFSKKPKIIPHTKTCLKCRIEKNGGEFHKNNGDKTGLFYICKACCHENYLEVSKNPKPKPIPLNKTCTKCKIEKDSRKFNKNKLNKDGLNSRCKNCTRAEHKEYDLKYYEIKAASARRRIYGVTEEQYRAMLLAQDNRCAIEDCRILFGTEPKNRPHIDHDHETGKVRALVCSKDNNWIAIAEKPRKPRPSHYKYLAFHKDREYDRAV